MKRHALFLLPLFFLQAVTHQANASDMKPVCPRGWSDRIISDVSYACVGAYSNTGMTEPQIYSDARSKGERKCNNYLIRVNVTQLIGQKYRAEIICGYLQ